MNTGIVYDIICNVLSWIKFTRTYRFHTRSIKVKYGRRPFYLLQNVRDCTCVIASTCLKRNENLLHSAADVFTYDSAKTSKTVTARGDPISRRDSFTELPALSSDADKQGTYATHTRRNSHEYDEPVQGCDKVRYSQRRTVHQQKEEDRQVSELTTCSVNITVDVTLRNIDILRSLL